MITTYLTSLKARFNPFSASSKIPRLFLTLLPADAHKTLKISSTALPRRSSEPSTLELGFKDGKVVKYSWGAEAPQQASSKKGSGEKVTLTDIVEEVDRHARVLARKEELAG
ncbi:mitochondrial 54S ribosomal protein YmL44 [Fonsecaea pedrosoi]|nr:mitochondrial 54S ribosomal protein YmL44 [Fonsecaea pedrosoi]